MNKFDARIRRATKSRIKMRELGATRLCVYRTSKHIYAQVLEPVTENVLVSASTLESEIKDSIKGTGNIDAATAVGTKVAERALEKGIKKVAFDRSGFRYHGRVKALADAARKTGLEI